MATYGPELIPACDSWGLTGPITCGGGFGGRQFNASRGVAEANVIATGLTPNAVYRIAFDTYPSNSGFVGGWTLSVAGNLLLNVSGNIGSWSAHFTMGASTTVALAVVHSTNFYITDTLYNFSLQEEIESSSSTSSTAASFTSSSTKRSVSSSNSSSTAASGVTSSSTKVSVSSTLASVSSSSTKVSVSSSISSSTLASVSSSSTKVSVSSSTKVSVSSSSSGSQSSTAQSLSSSTTLYNTSSSSESSIFRRSRNTDCLTYLSLCRSNADLHNPARGANILMHAQGFFDEVELPYPTGAPVLELGGLRKTIANSGAVTCDDAAQLFSISSGGMAMWVNLPYAITDGIYEPLDGAIDLALPDYILWAVNLGEAYITIPGFYAALTPVGIEFTIWSSAGRYSVLNTAANIPANQDFLLEFSWLAEPDVIRNGVIGLGVNGEMTQSEVVIDARHSLAGANFWVLDTPAGLAGLNGVLRRLETYSCVPVWLRGELEMSSSSTSFSSSSTEVSETSSSSTSSTKVSESSSSTSSTKVSKTSSSSTAVSESSSGSTSTAASVSSSSTSSTAVSVSSSSTEVSISSSSTSSTAVSLSSSSSTAQSVSSSSTSSTAVSVSSSSSTFISVSSSSTKVSVSSSSTFISVSSSSTFISISSSSSTSTSSTAASVSSSSTSYSGSTSSTKVSGSSSSTSSLSSPSSKSSSSTAQSVSSSSTKQSVSSSSTSSTAQSVSSSSSTSSTRLSLTSSSSTKVSVSSTAISVSSSSSSSTTSNVFQWTLLPLASYWSFNGTSADSVGTNHLSSPSGYTAGQHGDAMQNGRSYCVPNSALNATSSLVVSAWCYLNFPADWCYGAFCASQPVYAWPGWQPIFHLAWIDGQFMIGHYNMFNTGLYLHAPTNSSNGWHHLMGAVSQGQLELYVDGVLVASRAAEALSGASYVSVGNAMPPIASSWADSGSGIVDEVAVWVDQSLTYSMRRKMARQLYNSGTGKFYSGGTWS